MSDKPADGIERSVPTKGESEIVGSLGCVAREGKAECRLCGHVVKGDSFGEIFEGLAEHGEQNHDWSDESGWSR